ncbi:MAG TPA: CdaR family protein [Dehalococcoidia bacterium]|nr:CdaR family protein [Dehalococcoidia bacterium]
MIRETLREAWETIQRLLLSFRENAGLLGISIVLAIGLWMFVTNEENPDRTDDFPFPLAVEAVNVPENLAVFGPLDPVTIRVTAPEDTFEDLEVEDFRAVADLSNAVSGEAQVPVTVDYTGGRRNVDIEGVSPSTVTVNLQPLVEREFPVRVDVTGPPPLGLNVGDIEVTPEEVTVSGPEEAVALVDEVIGEVDLGSVGVALEAFETQVELVPRSSQGFTVVGVVLETQTADAVIEIERETLQQTVPVVVETTGTPAAGFRLSDLNVTPLTVVISGPLQALADLENISTEAIDLNDASESFTEEVALDLPDDVSAVPDSVTVEVTIEQSTAEATLGVAPRFINTAPGLTSSTSTAIVLVTVSGPLNVLQDISPEAVQVVVDLAGLGPGTYTLTPVVQVPDGVTFIRVSPVQITVTLVPSS